MVFDFKNLGIIESARIELKGLTIITGLNDTGKSFLSRTIYSITKTIKDADEQAIIEKYEQINTVVQQIFSLHRQIVPYTQQKSQEFNPNVIGVKLLDLLTSKATTSNIIQFIEDYKQRIVNDIRESSATFKRPTPEQADSYISRIEQTVNSVASLLTEEGSQERNFKSFFDNVVIQRLFQGQLNNLLNNNLQIKIREGETELLSIEVQDNKTLNFKSENLYLLNDATIIDTPTIIQLAKFITNALAFPSTLKKLYQQRTDLPYAYYDLLEKMNLAGSSNSIFSDVLSEIQKTIRGNVAYNPDEGGFVLRRDNGNIIRSFNIATGIKSFGLIQLLLNSGAINQRSLLVIDEPEVHLHPQWEVEYARIIVILSKLNIPIIVSSHSPYFLQAVAKYVKDYQTEDITKVYFGSKEETGNMTSFKDVTDDLEPIFRTLSEPMQNLYLTN